MAIQSVLPPYWLSSCLQGYLHHIPFLAKNKQHFNIMFSTWVSGTDHCGFLRGSFTTETQPLSCGRYRQTWQCSIVHHHDQLKLVIVFFHHAGGTLLVSLILKSPYSSLVFRLFTTTWVAMHSDGTIWPDSMYSLEMRSTYQSMIMIGNFPHRCQRR